MVVVVGVVVVMVMWWWGCLEHYLSVKAMGEWMMSPCSGPRWWRKNAPRLRRCVGCDAVGLMDMLYATCCPPPPSIQCNWLYGCSTAGYPARHF